MFFISLIWCDIFVFLARATRSESLTLVVYVIRSNIHKVQV